MSSIDHEAARKVGRELTAMAAGYAEYTGKKRANDWLNHVKDCLLGAGVPVILEGHSQDELNQLDSSDRFLSGDAFAAFRLVRSWGEARTSRSQSKVLSVLPDPKALTGEQFALILAVAHALGRAVELIGTQRARVRSSSIGGKKPKKDHYDRAISMFLTIRPTVRSDEPAFRTIESSLATLPGNCPGKGTLRRWIDKEQKEGPEKVRKLLKEMRK
jgi:hypothetical protein